MIKNVRDNNLSLTFFYAHGQPKEVCQLELTGVRRASREKIFHGSIVVKYCLA